MKWFKKRGKGVADNEKFTVLLHFSDVAIVTFKYLREIIIIVFLFIYSLADGSSIGHLASSTIFTLNIIT